MKKKAIIISGINGFLASNLYKKIISNKENDFIIIGLVKNKKQNLDKNLKLSTLKELENYFKDYDVDLIIHAATCYGKDQENLFNLIETNLILPCKILDLALKYRVKKFINIDTVLDRYVNSYSLSKKQFLDWFKSKPYSFVKKRVNIQFEHFYGPNSSDKNFIKWISDEILKDSMDIPLTLCTQKRDFLYIDDAVNAIDIIIKNMHNINDGFEEFHVGTNNDYVLKDVIFKLKKIANSKSTFNFGAIKFRDKEPISSKKNMDKILNLGWKPEVLLEKGLKKMLKNKK